MKKQINDLLLKMQTGENCIGETSNHLFDLFGALKSLPTEEEMTLEKRKTFKRIDEEIMNLEKMSYGVGFRKCFSWLSKDKDY
jgi:hypothetical protein